MSDSTPGFWVAPFSADGELMGTGRWELAKLSPKWLSVCRAMITRNGPVFRAAFDGDLRHLEVQFTSAGGSGLGMFFAGGSLAASAAYVSGEDPDVDAEVIDSFLKSLRESPTVKRLSTRAEPFSEMGSLEQRPLHLVIPWPNPAVTEEDQGLVQEISTHFAGAFLSR